MRRRVGMFTKGEKVHRGWKSSLIVLLTMPSVLLPLPHHAPSEIWRISCLHTQLWSTTSVILENSPLQVKVRPQYGSNSSYALFYGKLSETVCYSAIRNR